MAEPKTVAGPPERQRVPGSFFEDVVCRPVADFATLGDIERAVEQVLGRPLESGGRGVFPHRSINMTEVNQRIDKYLGLP